MKRWLRGALLAAAPGSGACTPPLFVSPAQGGPAWSKLTTKHFTLYSDVPADEAQEAARELEGLYAALEDVAFPYAQKPTGRFEVTLFAREDAYRAIGSPPHTDGYFTNATEDPDGRPMMVTYRGQHFDPGARRNFQHEHRGRRLDQSLRRTFQHELTHRFVAFYFPSSPTWLNEGLASFYETLETAGGKVNVGKPSPAWAAFNRNLTVRMSNDRGMTTMRRDELPNVAALVSMGARQFYARGKNAESVESVESEKAKALHYAASWNLVHTMRFGPPALQRAFDAYLVALARGDEAPGAWRAALRAEGVSDRQLEDEYRKHLERWGMAFGISTYAPRGEAKTHSQPMAEAEVRLVWARVRPWRNDTKVRELEDVDAAIKADPQAHAAYVLRAQARSFEGRHGEALADLREAVAMAPDDFRTTYALAAHLFERGEQDQSAAAGVADELAKLVDQLRESAGSAPSWNFIAWYDAKKGAPERGLPFARKAIAAAPACWGCYDTAALLLHRLDRPREAVAAQRIAVNLIDGKNAEAVKRLEEFERALAAAPPPAPPRPTPPKRPPSHRRARATPLRARPRATPRRSPRVYAPRGRGRVAPPGPCYTWRPRG